MTHLFTTIIVISFILSSCCHCNKNKHEVKKSVSITKKEKNYNDLNISLLLDLSDRIDPKKYPNPTMDFYKRDAAYIKTVAKAFDAHLRTKKIKDMNDKIQLFFDPEPLNPEINLLSKNLKIEITKATASLEILDKIEKAYTTFPEKIYELAIKDNQYIGSDTWKFFKNKAKDYCVETEYRNILIILTDGYIYHENSKIREANQTTYLTPQTIRNFKLNTPKWKANFEKENFGFIPATNDLSNLEILVLGINPNKNNPYEEDVIEMYWKNWFTEMGVKHFEIRKADLPSDMDKLIKEFILKN